MRPPNWSENRPSGAMNKSDRFQVATGFSVSGSSSGSVGSCGQLLRQAWGRQPVSVLLPCARPGSPGEAFQVQPVRRLPRSRPRLEQEGRAGTEKPTRGNAAGASRKARRDERSLFEETWDREPKVIGWRLSTVSMLDPESMRAKLFSCGGAEVLILAFGPGADQPRVL